MNKQNKPNLEDVERDVKKRTTAEQADHLTIAVKSLNIYIRGFQELERITPSEENELEWARRLLCARAFNSLRCAYLLLQVGYYTQALTLVRSVMEDWLIALDCESNPPTLKALLKGKGRMPRFEEMARRQGEAIRKLWRGLDHSGEGTYGLLSTFAHPRKRSLGALLDRDKGLIRNGGQYNADMFALTCYYLVTEASGFTEILARLVHSTKPASVWLKELASFLDEALSWRKEMTAWASARMREKEDGKRLP